MKNLFTLLLLFVAALTQAQFSKTHYLPPLTGQTNIIRDHYIYISTPNTTAVPFKIIENGGAVITGTVSKTSPYRYSIGSGDNTQLITPKSLIGVVKNKGYVIEADDLIYASIRMNASPSQFGGFNHAGGIVSKGNSALGKIFRLGAMLNPMVDATLLNFTSVLATENGTKVTISNLPTGTLLTDGSVVSGPITVTLNKNESYVLALENTNSSAIPSNSAKMIGALVEADKSVVVNAGSICGSNSTEVNGAGIPIGRDLGFDQIVPLERTGTEYIFAKGNGTDELERVLLVAHTDATSILLNGNSIPFAVLNKGEYAVIDGSYFSNGSLYIKTSEKVFAYQSIGGTNSPANQNMFFVPPLNCSTPNVVDNIPDIQEIGAITYSGGLNIITENGATVLVNNAPISALPQTITGNPAFVKYTITSLFGNIAVKSTKQVYVSYSGTNGAATYGGYYSGFDLKPEIVSDKIAIGTSSCIPNVVLKISSLSAYDNFQWYKDDVEITGATTNTYTPTTPGYYQVRGSISGCLSEVFSDKIPVSECPKDDDNDGTNNNIDIDWDNDGIVNTTEGAFMLVNQSNPIVGSNYAGTVTGTGSISGYVDYGFVSNVPAGKNNPTIYNINWTKPESVTFNYIGPDIGKTTPVADLANGDGDFIISVPPNQTLTITDPFDELLIDTNFDGIYESGVKEFTSFEIRFRFKSTTSIPAGSMRFKIQGYAIDSLIFKHSNLSESTSNQAPFQIYTFGSVDSDADGIPNQLDSDSDNDGILDTLEAQGNTTVTIANADSDKNGLDNAFEPGFTPIDTDNDGIPDYKDLDSDNDGILDTTETGSDQDADGSANYRDLDRDNDSCNDVIEAGFPDPDGDGKLGMAPILVDTNGRVIGAPYTLPNPNYSIAAPITITTQPANKSQCLLQSATFEVVSNAESFQWQWSTDGVTWNNLINNVDYTGVTTAILQVNNIASTMNGYSYRVLLNRVGNSCGLISTVATLTTFALPTVAPITIVQCDDDLDAISTFNLTVKNDAISSNAANEIFTYYTTLAGATTANSLQLITAPFAFTNTIPGTMDVWARVVNSNGCFSVAKINLQVVATSIPSNYKIIVPTVCDDFLDSNGVNNANNNKRDGIASFDLTATKATIQGLLPTTAGVTYNVVYYRNQADALSELNAITDIANYRNIGYPDTQDIWVRVDSDVDNACFGLGPFVSITVEKLPVANPVSIARQCDDNQDGVFNFDTSTLESSLIGTNQSFPVTVRYFDASNNPLKDANGVLINSPFPTTFASTSQIIKAVVTNNTTLQCFDETLIEFIVDDLPEVFPLPASLTTTCDDETDPITQDGKFAFDTSTIQATLLGGQTGLVVSYVDQNGAALPSPLPNPFLTATQNITVTIENPSNPNCKATYSIPFIVNPLPNINLNTDGSEDELVCTNLPTFSVQLDGGINDGSPSTNYTYVWTKDGAILSGQTNYTLTVNSAGLYTVEVINLQGCSSTRSIKVTASDIAKIESVEVVDLNDINKITINVSGPGDYEYSLNDATGPFLSSNVFENIPSGIHTLYVNDKNGCGIVSKEIAVVGAPKFFTPNGDGFNDYWNVKGTNTTANSKSTIRIFDRYGKLLKQIFPNSNGWDGTFNGQPLPADDYWYIATLEDGREIKGHFALKR